MSQTENPLPAQPTRKPVFPEWPTSKPGPKVTRPPAGTRRVPLRTEQVIETEYDQEHGKSAIRDEEE